MQVGYNPYEEDPDEGFDESFDGLEGSDVGSDGMDSEQGSDAGDFHEGGTQGDEENDGGDEGGTPPEPSGEANYEEEIDYSFLSEDLRPKDTASLESYKEAYNAVVKKMTSGEFAETILDKYRDALSAEEQEFTDMKSHVMAMRNNPREYIRTQMPEFAAEMGLDVTLTEEDMNNALEEHMANEFGEDWNDAYDERERFRIGSLSNKIMTAYQQKSQQLHEQNQKLTQAQQERIQKLAAGEKNEGSALTPQEQESILAEEYKRFEEHGISREDFDKFVGEASGKNLNVYDIYRAMNYEKLVQEAADKAYQEGKKGVALSIKKVARTAEKEKIDVQPRQSKPRQAPKSKEEFLSDYYNNGFDPYS